MDKALKQTETSTSKKQAPMLRSISTPRKLGVHTRSATQAASEVSTVYT